MHVTNEKRKCARHHLQLGKLKFYFILIKMTLVPINLTIPVASEEVEYQILHVLLQGIQNYAVSMEENIVISQKLNTQYSNYFFKK